MSDYKFVDELLFVNFGILFTKLIPLTSDFLAYCNQSIYYVAFRDGAYYKNYIVFTRGWKKNHHFS